MTKKITPEIHDKAVEACKFNSAESLGGVARETAAGSSVAATSGLAAVNALEEVMLPSSALVPGFGIGLALGAAAGIGVTALNHHECLKTEEYNLTYTGPKATPQGPHKAPAPRGRTD